MGTTIFSNYLIRSRYWLLLPVLFFQTTVLFAQTPKSYTSSEILLQLKKLNVLGSVLYIAAHPDDENTRLLAYLANEKMYRTGYLSLTRGDGGQNLIGDEQGVDLGLIRTQELLSARRIDGAEQFFSRAYDFGFCKTSEEAIKTWGHDKILSDIVWVIRKFKPDVIITRFPEDSRAGHGHHSASAILASEAFDAAADSTKFPEQLKWYKPWQAKRLLWNTFNFGTTNTQSEDQFKLDVGMYNPLLGKSYGEIAALSRSQHKSQGFGVPAQRGETFEYFVTTKGSKPVKNLMDSVDVTWNRTLFGGNLMIDGHPNSTPVHDDKAKILIDSIINNFSEAHPEKSVPALVRLFDIVATANSNYWSWQKIGQVQDLIEACSGLYLEAATNTQYAVQGDSLRVIKTINNRLGVNAEIVNSTARSLKQNINLVDTSFIFIQLDEKLTQPYWLENPMDKGSFNVTDQRLIGLAENEPMFVDIKVKIEGRNFIFRKPIRYKYTDPVKGEIYQPVYVVPKVTVNVSPALNVFNPGDFDNHSTNNFKVFTDGSKLDSAELNYDELSKLPKGGKYSQTTAFDILAKPGVKTWGNELLDEWTVKDSKGNQYFDMKEIDYDHIPSIKYFKKAAQHVLISDTKIVGKNVGYITGAGDKVPQALEQMGYNVTTLKENDLTSEHLKQFDAIITGVRAYNTNEWLANKYDALMQYVKEGGVLFTQYNTSNFISSVSSQFGPYPFTISRNRVTDETAKVNFLLPKSPLLNYPNKITEKDFEGWIQERSIYNAEKIDSNYQRLFSMKDPNETEQEGSLIVANYGKGRFIYSGIVFFRELPAGVSGAYRLFANLIANKRTNKTVK